MYKDLPSHIIVFEYPGKYIDGKEDLQKCKRYAYLYEKDDLNEKLRQGWKPESKATIFECEYSKSVSVKSSKPKGTWDET